jgi:hypothetical protein
LWDYRCKDDEATIARALQGTWRAEHRLALAQAVALSDVSPQQSTACDRHLEASLQTFADRRAGQPLPPPPRPRKRGGQQPACAVRAPLHRLTGVDVTQIKGLDETTSLVIRSASGLDRRRWPTVKHCTSWVGLCPHHRVSGGTVLRRRPKPCANRAATALRLAAACLHHSQRAVGAFFRRMKARMGAPKAITATAHTLARLLSTMLKPGTASVRQGRDEYAQQSRDRAVQHMTRRAKALGDILVKAPEGPPVYPALPGAVPGKLCTLLRSRPTGRNWGHVSRIRPSDSGSCETVCALVLRARCGKCGPGSPAAPSLVTGIVLIPCGRVLQSSPRPRPLPLCHCPILEAAMAPRKRKKSSVSDAFLPNWSP